MFRNLLKPDSALMLTMTQITDCIFLSLFWILGCIPVMSIGPAFAALYDASFRGLRKGEKHSWGRFLKVFKDNLIAGLVPTAVFLIAMFGVVRIGVGAWNAAVAGIISWGLFSAAAFMAVLLVGVLSILFPMLSRFENSSGALIKNVLLLGIANLPRTVALGMLNTVAALVCVRWVFPVFFLPSLAALIGSLFIEPMFRPFMPEEE